RVRDTKVFRHRLSDDPDDPVAAVDHERDRIPLITPDFPVDEEILQLSRPGRPEGAEPVPRPAAAHRQGKSELSCRDSDFRTARLPLPWTPLARVESLSRDRDTGSRELDLSRNRQRNGEI